MSSRYSAEKLRIATFSSRDVWSKAASDYIAEYLRRLEVSSKKTCLALSGGSTPKQVLEKLSSHAEINWPKVHLYQVDERYVSQSDPRSNARMIRETLADKVPAKFFTYDTSIAIPAALKSYEEKLPKQRPMFDLILLGVGDDGHTASLFPGSNMLDEKTHLLGHIQTKDNEVTDRLTLSFPALLNSKEVVILLSGQKKKVVLDELLQGAKPWKEFPAKRMIEDHHKVSIFYSEE